jgi:hypothetical protein
MWPIFSLFLKVIEVKMPEPKKPRDPSARPSSDEPLALLKVNVASSLKQALEKHMDNLSLQPAEGKRSQIYTISNVNGLFACFYVG